MSRTVSVRGSISSAIYTSRWVNSECNSTLQQLRLTANVTDADLTDLAKARATSAQDYLLKNAGLAPEKLSILEPVKVVGDGKTVNLKMNLGVAKK